MKEKKEIIENKKESKAVETQKTIFYNLATENVSGMIKKIDSGFGKKLSYLSWSDAWAVLMLRYPLAHYKIIKNPENLMPFFKSDLGYFVFTEITIENITREMWLPVLDSRNKALKEKSYSFKTKNGVVKTVDEITSFDINTSIMRCLTKNMAMFGLGITVYSGEDLPMSEEFFKTTSEKIKEALIVIEKYYSGKKTVEDKLAFSEKYLWAKKHNIIEILDFVNQIQKKAVSDVKK